MHPRKKAKTKEITKTILELLAVTSGITLLGMFASGRAAPKLARALGLYSRARIRETLKRLRMQGYIQYDLDDIDTPILLTGKGMMRLTRTHVKGMHHQKKKKWDYLWRMVIFDIPEKYRKTRRVFRNELETDGLFPLQRSVFVTPYACEEQLQAMCAHLGIQRYVLIFATASLGHAERKVRHHFFKKTKYQ